MSDDIKFRISAPGRIVLSGECGAMYGKHVVLASLNRRTTLHFNELPDETGIIIIDFLDVNILLTVPLEIITNFRSSAHFTRLISNHIRFRRRLQSLITGMWSTRRQRFSLEIFFFLFMHIARDKELNIKPFHVRVSTELFIGVGLGSSSSFAVCLSACFLHWARLQKGDDSVFKDEDFNRIWIYARLSEKVVLNYVFETDNDVCCYGKIIKSKYNTEEDKYSVDIINAPMINILLVDLKNKSEIGDRMEQIATQNFNLSACKNSFLNMSDEISIKMCEVLTNINNYHGNGFYYDEKNEYLTLQKIIKEYQKLLSRLNLSHLELKRMCSIAEGIGYAGTIAGYANNFAYILLPLDISQEQITNLSTRLEKKGFMSYPASVSCKNGLTIDNNFENMN